ncbi:MAG: SusC/RagA family TonB-linked outer membrane protein, partial [Bacteroidota bacterium]
VANIGQDVFRQYERPEFYSFGNKQSFYLDRWHGEGTSNSVPRMTSKDPNRNYRVSDFFVEDGDFLNIRTIQLGYTLPSALTEAIKIKKLRVYVVADNVFTLSDYTGFAENGIGDGWALASGIDRGFYPQPRTFRGGINLTF